MTSFEILLALLALSAGAFVLCRARAVGAAKVLGVSLHSLPVHYGAFGAMMALVIPVLILALWSVVQPMMLSNAITDHISGADVSIGAVYDEVRRVARGLDLAVEAGILSDQQSRTTSVAGIDIPALMKEVGVPLASEVTDQVLGLAQSYRNSIQTLSFWRMVVVLGLAIIGFGIAWRLISPTLRARHVTEFGIKVLLITASALAIVTTFGIVLSMLFESIRFFTLYPALDYLLGTHWAPNFRGNSELGLLPLLWGTLYISFVALLVAVPIGLFSAVYLSEYASKSVRAIAKPLLEVLAGVPTIVYGLFALLTFGPFLRGLFAEGGVLGVTWMGDSRSVLTAGVAMGIMLIPFVSSLSDDIINAVPQAMRDGALGLGATQSETVRQVILPAALPGVVGAILLAASRAIGETMIVVLGAGAIARFAGNPLEALTTVTTRIVAQLTGDGDFNSPETLVAFALGLTLFLITLGLNVLALRIVRKYREQYE